MNHNNFYALLLLCLLMVAQPAVAQDMLSQLNAMQQQVEMLRGEVRQKQQQLDTIQQQLDTLMRMQSGATAQRSTPSTPVETTEQTERAIQTKTTPPLFAGSSDDAEVLFSNEKAFATGDKQQAWPGWLNTFNINGNIALRYMAGSQQQFNQGFSDTFRLSDFNLDFSFEPTSRLDVNLGLALQEVQIKVPVRQGLKIDTNSSIKHQFIIKYASADYTFADAFRLRFGAFLTPFGVYNESLHADYDSRLVERPFLSTEIIPAPWTQLGIQLHGDIALSPAWLVNYALYTGNGLEAAQEKNGVIKSSRISDMTHQLVSRFNSNRALGGRLGLNGNNGQHHFEWGISAYHGAWNPLATLNLDMLGSDIWYHYRGLDLRAEWALARQGMLAGRQYNYGWYTQAAYRWSMIEPVFRLGRLRNRYTNKNVAFVDDRLRYSIGLNTYLGKFFILKTAYSDTAFSALPSHDHTFSSTLTAGF
ncbi:MAG: hypothetical protein R8K50_01290 [Mariprofundus sp.]